MSGSPSSPAVIMAIELAERPTLAVIMRRRPLPSDVLTLLKIAAGDRDACRQATRAVRRDPRFVREAAVLYLQTVVLSPEADAYRVLGVSRDAPQEQLREHLRWLMKWLHPDRTKSDWDSVFAQRVLAAWQEVKSADRRARYNRGLVRAAGGSDRRRRRRLRRPGGHPGKLAIAWVARTEQTAIGSARVKRLAAMGAAVLAAMVLALVLVAVLPGGGRVISGKTFGASDPSVSEALPGTLGPGAH